MTKKERRIGLVYTPSTLGESKIIVIHQTGDKHPHLEAILTDIITLAPKSHLSGEKANEG